MANTQREWSGSGAVSAAVAGVVTCPSCRTRWRLEQAPPGALCRCGHCASVFAAGAVPTAYVVRTADGVEPDVRVEGRGPVVASARLDDARADLQVGMDDPSLAARVSRNALNQDADGPRKPWTWTVKVEDDPVAEDEPPEIRAGDAADAPTFEIESNEPEPVAASEPEPPAFDMPDPEFVSTEAGPASLREAPFQEPEPSVVGIDDAETVEAADAQVADSSVVFDDPEPEVPETAGEFEADSAFEATGDFAVPEAFEAAAVTEPETAVEPPVESPDPGESVQADEATPAESKGGFEALQAAPPRRARPAALRLLVALLWTAAGAAAGWYAAAWLAASVQPWFDTFLAETGWTVPRESMFWAGPGAVFGLLWAWGCERWMGRRR